MHASAIAEFAGRQESYLPTSVLMDGVDPNEVINPEGPTTLGVGIQCIILRTWSDGKTVMVVGACTPVGNAGNYAVGGMSFDLHAPGIVLGTTKQPYFMNFSPKGGFTADFDYINQKMILRGQQPTLATAGIVKLTELTAAPLPAGVVNVPFRFFAIFPLLG